MARTTVKTRISTVAKKAGTVARNAKAALSERMARSRELRAKKAKEHSISHFESVLSGKEFPKLHELHYSIGQIIGDSETCSVLLKIHTPETKQSGKLGHLLYRAAIRAAGLVVEKSPEGKKAAAKILAKEVESIAKEHFSEPDAGRSADLMESGMISKPYFTRMPAISESEIFKMLQSRLQSRQ